MPRVTMSLVAAKAGVSKNTVSLALRGDPQISAPTRQRVARIAAALGYAKNPVVAQLMVELRKTHTAPYQRTLALLNANQDARAFTRHPTIPAYIEGCRRRAAFHGYTLDEFWLHDPALNARRLKRILATRGITGALVVGLMKENQLPPAYAPLWDAIAAVVTGVRTRNPTLPFCCSDHHDLVLQAVEQTLALGYTRPALAIEARIDRLVEGRFTSGMWTGQQALPARQRIPHFLGIDAARRNPALFEKWLRRHKPDAIFTLYNIVRPWLENLGLRIPRDIALIQLERRPDNRDWAGMDQHNDQTGEAAVDMLVAMLHNNESGVPAFPRATLISGTWTPGATIRKIHPDA